MSDSDEIDLGPQPIKSTHEDIGCFALVAWILGVLGAGAIICGFALDLGREIIYVGLVGYIIYLLELCQSKACRYLSHVQSEEDFVNYIDTIQKADPILTFSIQNYHYENVSTYNASQKKWTTKSERKNTHSATARFPIASMTDETLSPAQTVAMFHLLHHTASASSEDTGMLHETVVRVEGTGEKRLLLTCQFPLTFLPRDTETATALARFKEDFYRSNTTDKYQDKSEKQTLTCAHADHAMVVLSSAGQGVTERPWWMRTAWLVVFTLLLMGLPFRYFLYRRAQKVVWHVRKHFSIFPAPTAVAPMHSLKRSSDPAVARVGRLDPNVRIEFAREGGFWQLPQTPQDDLQMDIEAMAGVSRAEAPDYWKNRGLHTHFRCVQLLEDATDTMQAHIQQLLDDCFIAAATRDRKGALPSRLVVEMIQRVEDSALWQKYSDRRARIALKTDEVTQLEDLPGSGSSKTTRSLGDLNTRLDSSINELYLFHGSSPAGVLGIGSSGFNLDLAGSSAGMMFGPGAYFAEASSKGDEYATEDPSGLFAGKCAMLLCRVVCGELFRVEAADPRLVQNSRTGRYDGTLGDREHAAGTYREFVVYDQAQVYPEYVIIYRRIFD
ncbi:PARP11 [Symbiodinium sp. CCMP2456]|nr:PARP11 [Symbiodinium sp. CCMP2456]